MAWLGQTGRVPARDGMQLVTGLRSISRVAMPWKVARRPTWREQHDVSCVSCRRSKEAPAYERKAGGVPVGCMLLPRELSHEVDNRPARGSTTTTC